MTLRGRLTAAFLAVVLGPVLLGAASVAGAVTAVGRDRNLDRLDRAATAVRTSVGALCRQLQAVADTVAVLPAADRRTVAGQLVARDLSSAVRVVDDGEPVFETGNAAAPGAGDDTDPPWRDCTAPDGAVPGAVAASARSGSVLVSAAQRLDRPFLDRLAAVGGAAVTVLDGAAGVLHSTEPAGVGGAVAGRAARLTGPSAWATAAGRYVRAVAVGPGQPLPLAVSVPEYRPAGLYTLLTAVVLAAAAGAVAAARWLARSTTRPLAALVHAADRVAAGDLDVRVPVPRPDEVGRLAAAFNRMTRELGASVQALTASRDQLRGHLAVLGDTLAGTHDLRRILPVILHTARAATGARAGAVLLADPADGTLAARCTEGLTGRWAAIGGEPAGWRVRPGEGTLGAVAAGAGPRRGTGPGGAGEPPHRSYVAVPVCAPAGDDPLLPDEPGPPAVLGVLVLYDRPGAGFDGADLDTLRTFAGQAGVAVHNVRVHEEAQRLSLTDPLTGLWNYRYLRESLRREVERAGRFGRVLTVLVLDLDHFKEVNDRYGHGAGDAVLVEFARRVRAGLREVDLAFRQGGEEFVVLLPETDAYGAAVVAERLGAAVRELPVAVEGGRATAPVDVTVSVGIAVYPQHGATAQAVLAAADDALYAAKEAGRDTYRIAGAPGAALARGPHPPPRLPGR